MESAQHLSLFAIGAEQCRSAPCSGQIVANIWPSPLERRKERGVEREKGYKKKLSIKPLRFWGEWCYIKNL